MLMYSAIKDHIYTMYQEQNYQGLVMLQASIRVSVVVVVYFLCSN